MVRMIALRTLLVLAASPACYGLGELCGGRPAFAVWALAVTAACELGAVLLRASTVGRVTWKNRLAGCLIPWGWRLNAGRLWAAAAVSWLVWVIGAFAITTDIAVIGIGLAIGAMFVRSMTVYLVRKGTLEESPRRAAVVVPMSLLNNGARYGRRVRKVYLRDGYFGCRHCHRLT